MSNDPRTDVLEETLNEVLVKIEGLERENEKLKSMAEEAQQNQEQQEPQEEELSCGQFSHKGTTYRFRNVKIRIGDRELGRGLYKTQEICKDREFCKGILEKYPELVEEVGGSSQEVDATDAALELMQEHNIDPSDVEGTGADGRITKGNVTDYLEAQEETTEEPSESDGDTSDEDGS